MSAEMKSAALVIVCGVALFAARTALMWMFGGPLVALPPSA